MNKPMLRFLVPGAPLYFVVLLLFSAVAALMGQYVLAGAELAATVLLMALFRISTARKKREILRYVQSTTATLDTALREELPLPMAIVSIANNEIFWSNELFNQVTGLKPSTFSPKLETAMPRFSIRWLAEGKPECPGDYALGNRRYRVIGTQIHSDRYDPSLFLASIYLVDMTDLLQVRDEYVRSRPIVAVLLVDNYDELVSNLPDSVVSTINAAIDNRLSTWTGTIDGLLRKLERNRYLFLFEARDLPRLIENKFSILETIREVVNPSGIAATLSLGFGRDGARTSLWYCL